MGPLGSRTGQLSASVTTTGSLLGRDRRTRQCRGHDHAYGFTEHDGVPVAHEFTDIDERDT